MRSRIQFGDEIVIEQGAEAGRPSILHAPALGSAADVQAVEVGGSVVLPGGGQLQI